MRQRYRLLVESTPDWVWICDKEGRHTFSNKAIKKLLGYEVQEIIGISAYSLMHPEDRKKFKSGSKTRKKRKEVGEGLSYVGNTRTNRYDIWRPLPNRFLTPKVA